MNLENHTQKSQEAILAAQRLTQDYQHQVVEPIHLLLALVQQEDGIVRAIITKVSGGTRAIQEELSNALDKRPKIQGGNLEVGLSSQTAEVLTAAERYAKGMQDDYVSTEHLLLGLADSSESKRLVQFGLTRTPSCPLKTGARRPARHHAESRRNLPVAGKIRPRPDRHGPPG
jgi:ATP-dependent Clp protease ATP-binding subunit ClpB